MKTKKFNEKSQSFKNEVKEAKKSVSAASKNIFFLQKQLRQLAKKNDFCDGKSVAKVAKAVRNYTNGGSLFDISAFIIDGKGRFCTISTKKVCPRWGFDIVNISENGWQYLQPVTLTLNGVFAAFCKVAAAEIKAMEKTEKETICEEEKRQKEMIKEEKRRERIKVQKTKELQKAFDKGILTAEEFQTKIMAI